jgi:hypothetical protein
VKTRREFLVVGGAVAVSGALASSGSARSTTGGLTAGQQATFLALNDAAPAALAASQPQQSLTLLNQWYVGATALQRSQVDNGFGALDTASNNYGSSFATLSQTHRKQVLASALSVAMGGTQGPVATSAAGPFDISAVSTKIRATAKTAPTDFLDSSLTPTSPPVVVPMQLPSLQGADLVNARIQGALAWLRITANPPGLPTAEHWASPAAVQQQLATANAALERIL